MVKSWRASSSWLVGLFTVDKVIPETILSSYRIQQDLWKDAHITFLKENLYCRKFKTGTDFSEGEYYLNANLMTQYWGYILRTLVETYKVSHGIFFLYIGFLLAF